MPSWKVSMRDSMSNQTSHFGIMGGLYNRKVSGRSSTNRVTSRLTIPTGAAPGLKYMKMHNLLSKNPQGSGGVGKVVKIKPCNCGTLEKPEVKEDTTLTLGKPEVKEDIHLDDSTLCPPGTFRMKDGACEKQGGDSYVHSHDYGAIAHTHPGLELGATPTTLDPIDTIVGTVQGGVCNKFFVNLDWDIQGNFQGDSSEMYNTSLGFVKNTITAAPGMAAAYNFDVGFVYGGGGSKANDECDVHGPTPGCSLQRLGGATGNLQIYNNDNNLIYHYNPAFTSGTDDRGAGWHAWVGAPSEPWNWVNNKMMGMCSECAIGYFPTAPAEYVTKVNTLFEQGNVGGSPDGINSLNGNTYGCKICPVGSSCDGSNPPVACKAGTFSISGGPCINCPAGSYSGASATACTNCPAATSSKAGGACTDCSAGTFSKAGGACTNCSAGTFSKAGGACTNCSAGTFSKAGATKCLDCSAGQSSVAGGTCTPCPSGTFSNFKWQSHGMCINCPAGKSSAAGAAGCTPCAAGTVSIAAGAVCTNCPAGQSSVAGATTCTACLAGTVSIAAGTACTNCPAGTTSAAGATSCKACAAGTHSAAGGLCVPCPAGWISAAGGLCTVCAAGTTAATDQISCTPCPAGTSSKPAGKCTYTTLCPNGKKPFGNPPVFCCSCNKQDAVPSCGGMTTDSVPNNDCMCYTHVPTDQHGGDVTCGGKVPQCGHVHYQTTEHTHLGES